eukprot:467822-Pelagomonas_calceolata.AAC.1
MDAQTLLHLPELSTPARPKASNRPLKIMSMPGSKDKENYSGSELPISLRKGSHIGLKTIGLTPQRFQVGRSTAGPATRKGAIRKQSGLMLIVFLKSQISTCQR